MTNEEAIKFLQQLYPNGGHCWLDEQRMEAISMAVKALQEEPVIEVWHDASKEPNDMSHCLIFYGDKNDIGHYLHYEPVLYNHQEKVFVTESFPHPTGYKVEQKSIDGGCVAEVYKNKRDRISISDITQWCYLKDLHNLSNVERTTKNWIEEPVSEDFEQALAKEWKSYIDRGAAIVDALEDNTQELAFAKGFYRGAKWQKAIKRFKERKEK